MSSARRGRTAPGRAIAPTDPNCCSTPDRVGPAGAGKPDTAFAPKSTAEPSNTVRKTVGLKASQVQRIGALRLSAAMPIFSPVPID